MSQTTPKRLTDTHAGREAVNVGRRREPVRAASLYRGRATAAKGHMGGPTPT